MKQFLQSIAANFIGTATSESAAKTLVQRLYNPSADVRLNTIRTLAKFPESSLYPLTQIICDHDWLMDHKEELYPLGNDFVRFLAKEVFRLEAAGKTNYLWLLLHILKNAEWTPSGLEVQDSAWILTKAAKGRWGDCEKAGIESVTPVFVVIHYGEFEVNTELISALAHIGSLDFAVILEELGKKPKSLQKDHRNLMISALGRIGNQAAIEPLVGLLHDKDNAIRIGAALSLEQLGWFQSKTSKNHLHNILQKGWSFGDLTRINPLLDVMADPGLSVESKKSRIKTLMQAYYSVQAGQYKTCSCGYPNLTDLLDYKEISFEYEDYAERREVYYCPNCMVLLYKPIPDSKVVKVIE